MKNALAQNSEGQILPTIPAPSDSLGKLPHRLSSTENGPGVEDLLLLGGLGQLP